MRAIGFAFLLAAALNAGRVPAQSTDEAAAGVNAPPESRRFVMDPLDVVRHSLTLPPEKRYAYLRDWALPSRSHGTVRTVADFTPTHPAPPVADVFPIDQEVHDSLGNSPSAARKDVGGNLVAPLLELVDLAAKLGRLDELRGRLPQRELPNNLARRSQLAASCLIDLADGKPEDARKSLEEMRVRLEEMKQFWALQRWPELVACTRAVDDAVTRPIAADILEYIVTKQIQGDRPGNALWAQHVRALRGRAGRLTAADAGSELSPVAGWVPVTHPDAAARGQGFPTPVWRQTETGEFRHWPGFDDDYLYYPVPLRGDFGFSCELTSFGWREAQIGYGGFWLELVHTRDKFNTCVLNRVPVAHTIDPPLEEFGDWYRYRFVVRGGRITCFIGERPIHEQDLPAKCDPWLMLRNYRWCTGGMRNVRITVDPTVPESLELVTGPEMVGWSARYFDESIIESSGDDSQPDWS